MSDNLDQMQPAAESVLPSDKEELSALPPQGATSGTSASPDQAPTATETARPSDHAGQAPEARIKFRESTVQGDVQSAHHIDNKRYDNRSYAHINYHFHSTRGADQQAGPTDHTRPFLLDEHKIFHLSGSELAQHRQTLQRQQLLLIQCDDRGVAQYAAFQLMERLEIARDQEHRRQLSFFANLSPQSQDINLETFLATRAVLQEGSAVVVDLFERSSLQTEGFLRPLGRERGARYALEAARDRLRERALRLICIAPSWVVDKADVMPEVLTWHVDALLVLLQQQFPDDYAALFDTVRQLKDAAKGEPYEFYDYFRRELDKAQTPSDFLRTCDAYAQTTTAASASLLEVPQQTDGSSEVRLATLFTAAFFPGLALQDFDEVLHVFLREKTARETFSETYQDPDGSMKTRLSSRETPLPQLWRQKRREILRDCQITTAVAEDGQRYLTFQMPSLREEAKRLLNEEDPFYLLERFEEVLHAGLLFADSAKVAQQVVQLSMAVAVEHPERYGRTWLVEWVRGAEYRFAVADAQRTATVLADPGAFVAQFVSHLSDAFQQQLFYARMAYLLREMQRHPRLENVVEEFLEDLFSHQQHGAVCEFVDQLRDVPGFRVLYWLKRLIAESADTAVQEEALHLLTTVARQQLWSQPAMLDEIVGWVKSGSSTAAPVPPFYGKMLGLFNDLCLEDIDTVPLKDYGKRQTLRPIVSSQAGVLQPHPSLTPIAQALCHPDQSRSWMLADIDPAATGPIAEGLTRLLQYWFASAEHPISVLAPEDAQTLWRAMGEGQDLFDVFIAFVLVEWMAILFGLEDTPEPRPGALHTREAILRAMAAQMPSTRRVSLLAIWRKQQQRLRELHEPLRQHDRGVARVVAVRRGMLGQISDQFYTLHRSLPEDTRVR